MNVLTRVVIYVGKTIHLAARSEHHRRRFKKQGLTVEFRVIEKATDKNWAERERFWIAYYKPSLLNKTPGGESGWIQGEIVPPFVIHELSRQQQAFDGSKKARWGRDHFGCLDPERMRVVTRWAKSNNVEVVPYCRPSFPSPFDSELP